MTDPEASAAIDAAASRWVARLDGVSSTPERAAELAAELEGWLTGDRRRRGALVRAQAMWCALDAAAAPAAAEVEVAETPRRFGRRFALAGGGGLVAAALLGGIVWSNRDAETAVATTLGERRATVLADGSTILLNTASRSRVALRDTRRSVTLDEGEAWFDVASDRARPFVVSAGAVRVEAVGTAFAVRRRADRAEIVVTKGRVRVWSAATPARFLMLAAGQRTSVAFDDGAAAARVRQGGVADALAWRQGEIVLGGTPLGDAAAEFNRYNVRQLAVEAGLSEERLVGRFRTDAIEAFAQAAAAATGGRIERDGQVTRIVR